MTGEAIERLLSREVSAMRDGTWEGARAELRALRDAALVLRSNAHRFGDDGWHQVWFSDLGDSLGWTVEACRYVGEARGAFGIRDVERTKIDSGPCIDGVPQLTAAARTALGES